MPKLRVTLHYGATGKAFAGLEDLEGQPIDLGCAATPRAACRAAARLLRQAANRFDLLGCQQQPFLTDTQRRVNRAAVR